MTDRLSPTNPLTDADIDWQKAGRIATGIFDAIHDNVATKADVERVRADLEAKLDLVKHQFDYAPGRTAGCAGWTSVRRTHKASRPVQG